MASHGCSADLEISIGDEEGIHEESSHGKGKKRVYGDPGNAGRCEKRMAKKTYSKKRKFHGNQHSNSSKPKQQNPASLRKIKTIRHLSSKKKLEGFRLFDMTILQNFISSLACPECHECTLYVSEDYAKRKGLASFVSVNCDSCEYKHECYTSKPIPNSAKGGKPMEINYRAVYAARTVGHGYSGLEKLCGMLNLPRPMTVKNFNSISLTLGESAREVAETSMNKAANDLRGGATEEKVVDIGVSIDGTWQKRGFVSNNGTVAAISIESGKIIDIETMCRFCKACEQNKESLSKEDFKVWFENHKCTCTANYEGSAPMMDVQGATRIFERSIKNRGVRYTEYYGDRDSKAYLTVKDTYKPCIVKKRECVGHYQKRIGTRLRKLKKKLGKLLKILTEPIIDKLQNYFGMALRANTGNCE